MTQRRLTTLAHDLRAGGLRVVEIDGWQTRSRPESAGGFDPVGVLWHHTGGPQDGRDYADWLATEGRSDLPPPLCQLSIGRDGTVYVIAAGRANHAGKARASGSVAAGDGNRLYVGVECHNTGTEGWTSEQYGAMVKTGAALAKLLGSSVRAQRAHYETSVTGKWDPGDPKGVPFNGARVLDMDQFRGRIHAAIDAVKPKPAATRITKMRSLINQARAIGWEASKANRPGPRRWAINAGLASLRAALAALPKR